MHFLDCDGASMVGVVEGVGLMMMTMTAIWKFLHTQLLSLYIAL
jgi:hypothetical protein